MGRLSAILLGFILLLSASAIGAQLDYSVTIGSTFKINASDLSGIDQFTAKPKVYITGGDLGTKKKGVKVLNKGKEFKAGLASIDCEWKAKVEAGIYDLVVEPKVKGEKPEAVTFAGAFTVKKPELYALSPGTGVENDEITVTGMYFGTKSPKCWLEFEVTKNEKTKTSKKSCKIDKKQLAYENAKGKAVCMDPTTGASKFVFIVPKKLPEGTACVFYLNNKIAKVSKPFNDSNAKQMTIAVTPTDSGTTSPGAGLHTVTNAPQSIAATAATGYAFTGWSADPAANATFGDSSAASTTVIISADATVTATFAEGSSLFGITGTVSGDVAAGVTLTFSGTRNATATSASDGTYTFTGLVNGSYTVTPSLTGYTFEPTSREVTVAGAEVTGADFSASAVTGENPRFDGIQLAFAAGTDKVTLAWGEALDAATASSAIKYNVYQGTTNSVESVYQTGNLVKTLTAETEASLDELSSETSYYYLVLAEDEDGNISENRQLTGVTTMKEALALSQEPKVLSDKVTTDLLVASDVSSVTFNGDFSADYAVGDAILLPVDGEQRLKKISGVSLSSGVTTLTLASVALNDFVDSGKIYSSSIMSDMNNLPDSAKSRRVIPRWFATDRRRLVEENKRFYIHPKGKFIVIQETPDHGDWESSPRGFQRGASGSAEISAGVKLSYDMDFKPEIITDINWGWFSGLEDVSLVAQGTLKCSGDFNCDLSGAASYSSEKELYKLKKKFFYFVGALPVYQVVELSLNAKLVMSADAALAMSTGFKLEKSLKYGIKWSKDDGWKEISEEGFTKEFTYELSGEAGIDVSLTIYPKITSRFYGVSEGSLAILPTLGFDGDLQLIPRVYFSKFDVFFKVDGKIEADFAAFMEGLSWESDDIAIVDPITLLSLPSVKLTTAPTESEVKQTTQFAVSVTDGVSNAVTKENIFWSYSPEYTGTTLTPASDALQADFYPNKGGDYTITIGVRGGSTAFLGSWGEQQVESVITVNSNAAPVASDQSVTVSEDKAKSITLAATDADGDSLTYSVVANPSHGVLSGSAPNLTYTPTTDYTGSDSFTFKANDGIDDSNTATVSITVVAAPTGFVQIASGSFTMGDAFSEGEANERPTHTVSVSSFYMAQSAVTNESVREVYQWAYDQGKIAVSSSLVTLASDSYVKLLRVDDSSSSAQINFSGGVFSVDSGKNNYPCETISWYGAVYYCNYRSEMEGLTPCYSLSGFDLICDFSNYGYRLPTEAEWEKAARGGLSGKRFPGGDTISHSDANFNSYWFSGAPIYSYDLSATEGFNPTYNTGTYPYTAPVGSFTANSYNLYQMAGNVYEWCYDWYDETYYSNSPATDPTGPSSGANRICRGGNWWDRANASRLAYRNYQGDGACSSGFRLAITTP